MQSGLHGGHPDPPFLPHDAVIKSQIHACYVLKALAQETCYGFHWRNSAGYCPAG